MKITKKSRMFLSLALVAIMGLSATVSTVEAAKLSTVKDVLSDSGLSAESDHTISFKATSGIAAADTIVLKFDDTGDAFDLTGVLVTDMTMSTGTCGSESAVTLAATASGTTWGVSISTVTDEITITSGTDTVAAADCVVVAIDGTNTINNPSSQGVYDLDIVTTSDTGRTKLAVLPHVTADVTVDEALTFTVAGQTGAGECSTAADVDTTATSISYGSTNANTFKTACQELTVSTNASGGYSVTVQQDGDLTSAALDTIAAGTCDGACAVSTEAAWATATNNGFGYCVEDVTGTDGAYTNDCASATPGYRIIGTLGTDTPEVVMSNSGVVSSSAVELGYKISIDGAQQAGTYENDIIYVATPTY